MKIFRSLGQRFGVLAVVCSLGLAASATWAIDVPRFLGDRYIELGTPDSLQLPTNSPFTIEAWVRFEQCNLKDSDIFAFFSKNDGRIGTPVFTFAFGLRSKNTMMSARSSTPNAWREVNLPEVIVPGSWHHLAYSFNGTQIEFVFDGVSLGTTVFSHASNPTHTVKIGGPRSLFDIPGNISEVRMWNYDRTASQIATNRFQRLLGSETGLLGYWPLDEGTGTQVFDRSGNDADGTFSNNDIPWVVETGLDLMQFAVAHPVTGSTRFTSTNELAVVGLSMPEDCDAYQLTLSGDPSGINPVGWIADSVPPANVTFDWPIGETNIAVHAWFTNSVSGSILHHTQAEIVYTTVAPVLSVRPTLTREQLPTQSVTIDGSYLDNGSTGGTSGGTVLDIFEYWAVAANPADDQTPESDQVTLAAVGTYPLLLRVMNEAGQVVTGTATCQVTVASYSGINSWTGNGVTDLWSDGGNWSADVPVAGQDVSISSGSGARLTESTAQLNAFVMTGGSLIFADWTAALKAVDVTISGGTVTCAGDFYEVGPSNRVWVVCTGNFSLTKPGQITVDGQGYKSMSGPGTGIAIGYGTGGGHGGRGGEAYMQGGNAYGDFYHPETPGSGGTPDGTLRTPGGSGGGAVRISVGGTASINGVIQANGINPTPAKSGGGAGGSIYITAAQFTGNANGRLLASGGNAGWSGYGGGGGGGRIAIDGGTVAVPLAVRMATVPGKGDNDRFDTHLAADLRVLEAHQVWTAGWGTLYIEDENFLSVLPVVNQFDSVNLQVGQLSSWTLPELTLTNNSFRLLPAGFQLNVTGDLTVGADAHLGVDGSIACGGNLMLTNGARLSIFSPVAGESTYGASVEVTNDILIAENSWLQPNNNATNGGSVRLRMRNLRILGKTGGINAMGRGYAAGHGPGKGGGVTYYGCGGGYGGVGGKTTYGAAGITYGNEYAPLDPGSGGGGSYAGPPLFTGSGYGGGLISIEAAQNVFINGQIIASGAFGTGYYLGGAGGAGGGIFISCNQFSGTTNALLAVNGGNSPHGGGGGGGRIAVWHKNMPPHLRAKLLAGTIGTAIASTNNPDSYLGQIDIGFGTGGTPVAQPGTVWFITPPPHGAMLLVR